MKDNSDIFNRIGKAEISPFVWTRIQQKIKNRSATQISFHAVRALVVSLVVLLILNAVVLNITQREKGSAMGVAQSMNLLPQNSLYGE